LVSLLLGELVPHDERVVGNTWNGVGKNVFEEPGGLGSPLFDYANS
jgi:hypothetical protein